jgi:predicted permease
MRFPDEVEMWIPRRLDPADLPPWHALLVVGRLQDGVGRERAQSNMETIAARLAQEFPRSNEGWGASVTPLREKLVGDMERDLLLLFGAVVFVLAIACANVSSLYLARLSQRSRELAVRSALGGERRQLIGQLLAESVVLSLLGGLAGLVLGHFALPPILAMSDLEIPSYMSPELDSRVVLFTLGVTLLTGIVFGLVPALRIFRTDLFPFLREGTRSVLGARSRLMSTLVIVEVALALVLLSGAGLLIRSLQALQSVDPGFDQERLLTMRLSLPRSRYPEPTHRAAFFERAVEELAAVPGVRSAALTTTLPLAKENISGTFTVEGYELAPGEERQMANSRMVSPGYFHTLGITLAQGRDFSSRDHAENPGVVLVSREMVRRYFPDQEPLGRRVKRGRPDSSAPWLEIVGVVGDVRDAGLAEDLGVTWYMPYAQNAWGTAYLVVRTAADPEAMSRSVREAIWKVDRDQPVYGVATMENVVAASISQPRFKTLLFGLFAGVALLLATVGIYGVISFATTERVQEFGLRMALGSSRGEVWRLVVRHGLKLTAVGLACGLLGSFFLGRWLTSSLYQVSPHDLGILLAVVAVLLVAAFLATFFPAYRATRVDPMVALRWE